MLHPHKRNFQKILDIVVKAHTSKTSAESNWLCLGRLYLALRKTNLP